MTDSQQITANKKLQAALQGLQIRGMCTSFSYDGVSAVSAPFHCLYSSSGEDSTSVQVAFGNFSSLNSDIDTAELWQSLNKSWSNLVGFGCLLLKASFVGLFESESNPTKSDELSVLEFLDRSLTDDWKIPVPFAVRFGEEFELHRSSESSAVLIYFTVSVPVSADDWLRAIKVKELELEAAKKLQQYMIEEQLRQEQRLAPGSDAIN